MDVDEEHPAANMAPHIADLYKIIEFDSRCKQLLSAARTPTEFQVSLNDLQIDFDEMSESFASEDAHDEAATAWKSCKAAEWRAFNARVAAEKKLQ